MKMWKNFKLTNEIFLSWKFRFFFDDDRARPLNMKPNWFSLGLTLKIHIWVFRPVDFEAQAHTTEALDHSIGICAVLFPRNVKSLRHQNSQLPNTETSWLFLWPTFDKLHPGLVLFLYLLPNNSVDFSSGVSVRRYCAWVRDQRVQNR